MDIRDEEQRLFQELLILQQLARQLQEALPRQALPQQINESTAHEIPENSKDVKRQ